MRELTGKTGYPVVIKADGLAAGKGVIIAQDQAEADAAIDDMLAGNKFGDAGSRVVIEEFLKGEEASFIVMVDGKISSRWRPAKTIKPVITPTTVQTLAEWVLTLLLLWSLKAFMIGQSLMLFAQRWMAWRLKAMYTLASCMRV